VEFAAEQDVRRRASDVALAWYEENRGPFRGSDPQAYRDMVVAAHVASEESRLAMHRWVDAARRASLSWAEIGSLIGTSKQAAQQRFGGAAQAVRPAGDDIIVRHGATEFNEMEMLDDEGRAGRELVDTGFFRLFLRQTDQAWEYQRVAALFPDRMRRKLEAAGWTWVSTWYPFHYFKRATGPLD